MSDYDIGYGKPPKKGQFKPGQSGNPKGRPKGSKSFSTVLRDELGGFLTVKEGGKTRRVTKLEAVTKRLISKAMNGDPRAMAELFRQMNAHLSEESEGGAASLPATESDIAMLEDFFRRAAANKSGGEENG